MRLKKCFIDHMYLNPCFFRPNQFARGRGEILKMKILSTPEQVWSGERSMRSTFGFDILITIHREQDCDNTIVFNNLTVAHA